MILSSIIVKVVSGVEIRQLKTFMNIVKLGNFSQAAEFQSYTQSTVTTHIQLLEKELNTTLFERFGHQLMLTADGEILYDYAEKITKLTEDAKNALYNSNVPRGRLIIGMPESLCVYHFPALIKEYSSLYPEVELMLKIGISRDIRTLARKNMIDIAFLLEENVADSDFVSKFLWSESIIMVASPEHPLAKVQFVEAKDLRDETLILVESGSSYRTVLEKQLKKADVHCKTMLEVCQIQTIKELVMSNLGVTVLPLCAVKNELAAGTLTVLPWQDSEFQMNAFLVHHKEKWLSHAIRSFIKLVQERLIT